VSKDKDQPDLSAGHQSPDTVRLPQGWSSSSQESESIVPDGRDDFDRVLEGSDSPFSHESMVAARKDREAQSRKRLRNGLFVVLGLVLLTALGFGSLLAFDGYKAHRETQRVEQEKQQQETEKAKAIKQSSRPFSVLVGEVDPPSDELLSSAVENDELKIGGATLSIKNGKLAPTVNGCTLGASTDICMAAKGTLGDGDFDVFVLKDISRTRILDDPKDFSELQSTGGTIAASMAIDMGAKEGPTRVGALTASGTTGFILVFPQGTSTDRVNAVLKAATVL